MRVKKIHIEHYKCIDNLDVDVKEQNLILCGDNEKGKSSMIQFIQICFGKKINIPADGYVIANKQGEEFTFQVRSDKSGKNIVRVIYPDGSKDDRTGSLNEVCGTMSFDIIDFVKQSESSEGQKKQAALFLSLLPEDIQKEIKRLEANVDSNYIDRTETNRDLKKLEGALKSSFMYNDIHQLDKFKSVDVTTLSTKLNLANKKNMSIENVESGLVTRRETISSKESEIKELEAKILLIKDSIEVSKKEVSDGEAWLKTNKKVDTDVMLSEIKNAAEINKKADEAERLQKQIKEIEKAREDIGDLTVLIDTGRQAITDCIKDCGSDIPGLSYSESILMYAPKEGEEPVPVTSDNLSTSTIIELGLKMVYAQNPELPMFIENSNVIGKDRMAAIRKFAEEKDLQLILEKVVPGQDDLSIELFS